MHEGSCVWLQLMSSQIHLCLCVCQDFFFYGQIILLWMGHHCFPPIKRLAMGGVVVVRNTDAVNVGV